MITLSNLKNTTRPKKRSKRVGRGPGSGLGKTCGRGEKGAGARSGYKRRLGYEGGQFRTFMKLPQRGFNNTRFQKPLDVVNLGQIEVMYTNGEVVDVVTLAQHGFISGRSNGIKILGKGELTKKVTIHADAFSDTAREKLQKAKIKFTTTQKTAKVDAEEKE
jgi:large subunit ribosomal protein L15